MCKTINSVNFYVGDTRVKMLICHGGLNSVMESIYYGVPVIGLPTFYDHYTTMVTIESLGVGKQMKWSNLTEETFNYTINYILNSRE